MRTTVSKITGIIAFLIIVSAGVLKAQDSTRIIPFHLSFITPLGTNGMQSWNTTNLISFNMFAGFSGGLKGVEFGGFANALKSDMNGIQIAGFCNNTFGYANGLEISGFWNFNRKKVVGCQFSGFANVALDTIDGIQGSGFANITVGDTKGVQAAGFSNVTTGKQTGIQVSGFLNYARILHGVQLGFVNVADTIEKGIPIGFLSFVRNGYKVIQVGGNETLYGEISFKTGVRQFYNILSVGAATKSGSIKWGFGYGIGTLIPVGKRMDLSLEAVSYQINEDAWYTEHMNMLNRLNVSLSYNITRIIGAYAGGSWNVMVTGNEMIGEHPHHWKSEVSMYPGFTAGLRIGL
ncbi:MAG: hypothetical protein NTV01_22460 [Bacteroidia bacterium]|nr:hypothetical protein [Bacteroidia bacterium]